MKLHWDDVSPFVYTALMLVAFVVIVGSLTGCSTTKERGFKTDAGYEVVRIDHDPDPVRMSAMTVTKFVCAAEIPEDKREANASQYTGCRQLGHPQMYAGEGWLTSFVKTGMIASSVWAAGHEIGGMQPDHTVVKQQAKQSTRVQSRGRR